MTVPLALSKRGLRHGEQRRIAKALGVSDTLVSRVVNGTMVPRTAEGRATCRRVQLAVARALKVKVAEAFPQEQETKVAAA